MAKRQVSQEEQDEDQKEFDNTPDEYWRDPDEDDDQD